MLKRLFSLHQSRELNQRRQVRSATAGNVKANRAYEPRSSVYPASANRWWQIGLLASFALVTTPLILTGLTPGWSLLHWLTSGVLLLGLLIFAVAREHLSSAVLAGCLLLVWMHLVVVAQQSPVFSAPTDLEMTVRVLSIPDRQSLRIRAKVAVESGHVCRFDNLPCRVQLAWYRDKGGDLPHLVPGQRWRVSVRLKPLWDYANPGGFEYANWLKRQGITASGYVRHTEQAVLLGSTLHGWLGRIRMSTLDKIRQMQPAHPSMGLLIGLAVGVRSYIDDAERQLLVKTGTAHLLAISGMHIGMIASVGFVIGGLLWRGAACSARSLASQRLMMNRARAASAMALTLAGGYALMAGFTLPTQRALLTLLCLSGLFFTARRVAFRHVLLLVLMVALLIDPLSTLSPGVWLSFGAVSALIWVGGGRVASSPVVDEHNPEDSAVSARVVLSRIVHRVKEVSRIQLALSVLLVPMTVVWFGQLSLVAPIANLIAIPMVGVLVLPMLLVALLLEPVAPGIAGTVLGFAGDLLQLMLSILSSLASLPLAGFYVPDAKPVALLAAIIAVLCLTKPAGGRLRWLAFPISLPFITSLLVVRPDGLLVHVLDVGQGQAVVVESGNYVLLYDTGAGIGEFSAFRRVIQPFFRYRGISQPDQVVISHPDNDHAGGLAHLRSVYPDVPIMSPSAFHADVQPDSDCHAGKQWQYRDIEFSVLYPDAGVDSTLSDNNLSCVLLIRYGDATVLIPGDIEARAESVLMQNWPSDADAIDLLIAPHHGSASSSGAVFVDRLQPVHVVFSAGRWNRYEFPDADVAMRYINGGSSIYQTGLTGSIHFSFNRDGSVAEVRTHRRK